PSLPPPPSLPTRRSSDLLSSIDPGGSTFPERLLQRRRARSLSCSGWFLTIVNAMAQWLLPRLLGETTRIYATRAARVARVTRVARVARVTRAARVTRPTGPAHWNGQPGRAAGPAHPKHTQAALLRSTRAAPAAPAAALEGARSAGDQSLTQCDGDRLGTRMSLEFGHRPRDVHADGLLADEQFLTGRPVRQPAG